VACGLIIVAGTAAYHQAHQTNDSAPVAVDRNLGSAASTNDIAARDSGEPARSASSTPQGR